MVITLAGSMAWDSGGALETRALPLSAGAISLELSEFFPSSSTFGFREFYAVLGVLSVRGIGLRELVLFIKVEVRVVAMAALAGRRRILTSFRMMGVRIRIRRRILLRSNLRVLFSVVEGWILLRVVKVGLMDFSVPSAGVTFTPAGPRLPL
jgi:hypothetical protein